MTLYLRLGEFMAVACPSPTNIDLRGLTLAPVTPFTEDGRVDFDAIQRLGSWLGSIKGDTGLVVLGHAGEGTFLTQDEQVDVIKAFVRSVDDRIPIIAGITCEGTQVAAVEAKRAKAAGAEAGLLYPSHGWLRFGYQPGAPQDRYKTVYEDTEIPLIRKERPKLQILTCHDEYLLHTAFDVDGMLVGYGNIAPEPLIELIEAGKAKDYRRARSIHDQLLPVTSVYHRGSHMEGTVALKHALVARGILQHATVRPPLLPLPEGAAEEIHAAVSAAKLKKVETRGLK
ncbi:hypothetical protein LA080_000236 [Diaporthe eres]|nr:hypothetical protein LA080_000236 [Diaporthe eres]